MSRPILGGSADVSTVIRIVDSTDGSPETGVVAATAGLALWYRREGATVVALTESDLAQTDSAHSDGGMIHLGDGYYRVDLPDAAVLVGSAGVMVGGTVTGMVVIGSYHAIDAPSDVRKWLGTAPATPTTAGVPEVDVTYVNGTAAEPETSPVAANVTQISGDSTAADNLEIFFDGTGYNAANSTIGTCTTNTDMRGTDGANTVVPDAAGTAATLVGDLQTHGDTTWATATGFSTFNAASDKVYLGNGAHGGAEATLTLSDYSNFKATGFSTHSAADVVTALGTGSTLTACATATGFSTLDAAGVRTAVGLASANLDTQLAALPTATENADAILSRDVDNVEASAGEHTLCTIILASLESSVSGTTWTIKRTDGSTTHATKTVTSSASADPITGVS